MRQLHGPRLFSRRPVVVARCRRQSHVRRRIVLGALAVTAVAALAPSPVRSDSSPCPAELTARIPPRKPGAIGGTEFILRLQSLPRGERQGAIVAELLDGNLPSFLRKLARVEMSRANDSRRRHAATICVMPDFLAVGSDDDFVRVPMDLPSSTRVAREFGFILPTRKMVQAIHRQAAYRFNPEPMTPSPQMRSPGYYRIHNGRIRTQRESQGVPLGVLVAGHKKTIVLTNRFHARPGRVAIFGWFRRDGTAIQPLSTAHGARYADYSHGVRLVSEAVTIDGQTRSVYDVLDDPHLAPALSREGRIRDARKLMGWPATDETA